jgi:hypothetical protein
MVSLAQMQADTAQILTTWGETLTVKRKSVTYPSDGKASITWATNGTITGDWQAVRGSTIRDEEGMERKSFAIVIAAHDADVQQDDQVHRAGGEWGFVNYVRSYEDHRTIYLTKTEGAA